MLRDEIVATLANMAEDVLNGPENYYPLVNKAADVILGLFKTRLEVEEKCHDCSGMGTVENPDAECPTCHGTGTITRPATWEEVVEVAEQYVESLFKVLPLETIILSSGTRVRLKEGK